MPESTRPKKTSKRSTPRQRVFRVYVLLTAALAVLVVAALLLPRVESERDGAPEADGERDDGPQLTERYPPEERLPEEESGDPNEAPLYGPGRKPDYPEGEMGPQGTLEPGRFTRPERPEPEPEIKGSLAIVIDDVGNSLVDLEPFLQFEGPLTVAVLPHRRHSQEAAERAAAYGKEVILHLPMEPVTEDDPGPGAVYADMSSEDIADTVQRNLQSIPGIRGVNNHMGSRATADPEVMETVLSQLADEELFFLDSRTAANTVGPATAEEYGIPHLERTVFLDNESNRDYIRNAVREGMDIAERKGHAVMIGHVMVNELVEVLNEMYPFIQDEGFDLRYLSELVLPPETDEDTGN
ncbi:MAG: divergent polysaccharide deacetylase family protein [Spirochaetaceae bacterium]